MIIKKSKFLLLSALLGLAAFLSPNARAAVTLDSIFNDDMVLQRGMKVPIWGLAAAGEQVTVSFNGQEKKTTAAADGKWMVKLDTLTRGGPLVLKATGSGGFVEVRNVAIGEVWLCCGQSNMATRQGGLNANDTIGLDMRYMNHKMGYLSLKDWTVVTGATIGLFSAAGAQFGRALDKELDVTIGLISIAQNGASLESFISPASIAKSPDMKMGVKVAGQDLAGIFTSYVQPLIPFAVRGVIWYQGETNAGFDVRFVYADHYQLLVEGWREAWGQGNFPFYSVQLPGFTDTSAHYPDLREQQRLALRIPRTGMAITTDIGGALHGSNKKEVGIRLSKWALTHNYDKWDLVFSGPIYESMQMDGNRLRLKFRHFGGGLKSSDGGALKGFEIAGADSQFVPAVASIEGDLVIVSSPQITKPVMARFAWLNMPLVSLVNKNGLPASPFCTNGKQPPASIFGCVRRGATGYSSSAWIHEESECLATATTQELPIKRAAPDKLLEISNRTIHIVLAGAYGITIRDLSGRVWHKWEGRGPALHTIPKISNPGIHIVSIQTPQGSFIQKTMILNR